MIGAEPGDGPGIGVSPEHRSAAVVRGGDEDGRAVRGPGQFRGPVLQPGEQVRGVLRNPVLRGRVQRYLDHGDHGGLMIGLVAFTDGHDPLAVRRDPGRGEVESGGGQQGPVLARARVDDHDVLAQPSAAVVDGPSGDGHPPVRGQLEAVLIQGPARLGGQVPRGDLGPGAQRVGDQQPQLVRAEVMVPVPDQGRFVQDGRHARVGAGPALLPVRGGPAGAGQRRRGERGPPRAGSGGQLADAPGGCGDLAGLPARGRQQPQRPLPGSVVAPRLGLVRGGGRERRAGGQEQHPAVRQEGGTVLALSRPGQPGRGRGEAAGPGVDPPDAGLERPPVRGEGGHGHGQPAAVRGQPQAGEPGQGQIVVQIVEWGHCVCAFSPRTGPLMLAPR